MRAPLRERGTRRPTLTQRGPFGYAQGKWGTRQDARLTHSTPPPAESQCKKVAASNAKAAGLKNPALREYLGARRWPL
jgi:hypothetical protein